MVRRTGWSFGVKLAGVALAVVSVSQVSGQALAAGGGGPTHFSEQVDFSFVSPYYTDLCGFDVSESLAGTLKATLFFDRSGTVLRETDTQPGAVQTFSSATTGRSFSWPFASTLVTTYPNGTALGAPAVARGSGLAAKIPGVPADAGVVTFGQATVVGYQDDVPVIDLGPITGQSGHSNDFATEDAAICAALAG
jgi:hypothetical protein